MTVSKGRGAAALAGVALALALGAATPAAACDVPRGAGGYAQAIVQHTNGWRARIGAPRVSPDAALTRAAQAHACEMARRGVMSHRGANGSGPGDRARAAGFRWNYVAENVAYGQRGPDQVSVAWMNSPGHRANMLDRRARRIGVAVAMAGGRPYWAMVLAAPR